MLWGFSKNIGGGFRVGFGGRIGGGRSRGPIQAELKKQEKEEFLRKTNSQADDLFKQYFVSLGVLPLSNETDKYETDETRPFLKAFLQFAQAHRLVTDGGNLTEKRREQMLTAIYAMEDMISKIEAPHSLANSWQEKALFDSVFSYCLLIFIVSLVIAYFGYTEILIGLAILSFMTGAYASTQSNKVKAKMMSEAKQVIGDDGAY